MRSVQGSCRAGPGERQFQWPVTAATGVSVSGQPQPGSPRASSVVLGTHLPVPAARRNGTAQSFQTTPSELSTESDHGHQRIQREIPPNPAANRCPADHFRNGSICVLMAIVRSRRPSSFMPLTSIVNVPVIRVESDSEKMWLPMEIPEPVDKRWLVATFLIVIFQLSIANGMLIELSNHEELRPQTNGDRKLMSTLSLPEGSVLFTEDGHWGNPYDLSPEIGITTFPTLGLVDVQENNQGKARSAILQDDVSVLQEIGGWLMLTNLQIVQILNLLSAKEVLISLYHSTEVVEIKLLKLMS